MSLPGAEAIAASPRIVGYWKVRSAIILWLLPNRRLASCGDQRTSSRTLLAIITVWCSPNSLWRLQSPNYSRTFGYTFGYRHQFGLFTLNFVKPLAIGHLDGRNPTVNYAYLS